MGSASVPFLLRGDPSSHRDEDKGSSRKAGQGQVNVVYGFVISGFVISGFVMILISRLHLKVLSFEGIPQRGEGNLSPPEGAL